jgi:succinate dehydrogenase / fumarate reductase cytochrome b subunit
MRKPLQVQKRVMALAGVAMTIYLVFHMLIIINFFNPSSFTTFYDWYNNSLVHWIVLVIMAVAIVLHVKTAITIRRVNAQARIIGYKKHDKLKIPAIFVTVSIIFLLGFILIHVFQTLTFETSNTYAEIVQLFQSPFMVMFYFAGLFVLLMHLHHSLANVLQTLGKTSKTCHMAVWTFCLLLIGGFASVPFYICVVMP